MKKIITLVCFMAFTNLAFSSASITKGTSQVVSFTSSPEGATVQVNGNSMCQTPCAQNLKKNKFTNVTFKLEGYRSVNLPITSAFDGTAVASALWDCGTTDTATGAIYEYSPAAYHADMKKIDNWKENYKFLNKGQYENVRSYILINYSILKKELTSNNLEKKHSTSLLYLMKEAISPFNNKIFEDLKDSIIISNNPIEVLVRLPKEFQNK